MTTPFTVFTPTLKPLLRLSARISDLTLVVIQLSEPTRCDLATARCIEPLLDGVEPLIDRFGESVHLLFDDLNLARQVVDFSFDDLNAFRLPGYASAQFVVRQHLARSLSAEVTLENALNRQFYTAFTPTPNIGAPRLWRAGLRWDGRVH